MLNLRAWIPEARGDVDRAAELFAEVLQLARSLADTIPVLIGLANLPRTQMRRGYVAAAAALYTEGVRLAVQAGDEGSAGYNLSGLAAVAAARASPCGPRASRRAPTRCWRRRGRSGSRRTRATALGSPGRRAARPTTRSSKGRVLAAAA